MEGKKGGTGEAVVESGAEHSPRGRGRRAVGGLTYIAVAGTRRARPGRLAELLLQPPDLLLEVLALALPLHRLRLSREAACLHRFPERPHRPLQAGVEDGDRAEGAPLPWAPRMTRGATGRGAAPRWDPGRLLRRGQEEGQKADSRGPADAAPGQGKMRVDDTRDVRQAALTFTPMPAQKLLNNLERSSCYEDDLR